MNKPTTKIVNWNHCAVESAVELLTEGWSRQSPLVLDDHLLLTQTKGAGRRLRFALAQHADDAGQGVLPPRFATPSVLFTPTKGITMASEIACLLLWEQLLKELDLSEYDALLPKPPEEKVKADGWTRAVAKSLHGLRRTLSEADFDCGKVADSESLVLEEPERWLNLARLEELYRERLAATGLDDPFDAKRKAADSPVLADGLHKVMVLGVSGFPGLAQIALERLADRGVPVDIVAFGPEGAAFPDLFDDWGRPSRSAWEKRPVPLQDDQLFLMPDERAQATAVMDALGVYGDQPEDRAALGVVDSDLKPFLKQAAEEAGTPFSFSDPEGQPATASPFYALLSALAGLVGDSSYRQAVTFLRFPETRAWLAGEGIALDSGLLFAELDDLLSNRIPVSLRDAIGLASGDLANALRKLAGLVDSLRKGQFGAALRDFLVGATAKRSFDSEIASDQSYLSLAPVFSEILDDLDAASEVSVDSAFIMLLDGLRSSRILRRADTNALPMQGWLELPWEPAPRLIVAGFNEGCVPDPVPGDTFLPENLRCELGLWTSEDRFARDAYLLQWLLASRSQVGRVDILLGKWKSGGDPLKPSRLLFLCDSSDEAALPNRARHLFREVVPTEKNPAWRFAWRLDPGDIVPAKKISVTQFSTFLTCPYRFHLKQNLKMRAFDPGKNEADPMDFGSLVHDILEAFGKCDEIRGSDDADAIREFFREKLDKVFGRKFGASPGLPLLQQKNTAWRRLSRAAEVQATERSLGWVPVGAETWMSQMLDGVEVRGRIDRIDRHEETGCYRVLDYKTSGTLPQDAHWVPATKDLEQFPEYCLFELTRAKGKPLPKRWTNLQLPLYRWWAELQAEFAGSEVSVGYFLLPAEQKDIGVSLWPELDEDMMALAMACAKGVVAELKAGWQGSPRAQVKYEDFADVFFHDPQEAALPLSLQEDAS